MKMDVAKLVLEFVKALIWPIVAALVILMYGKSLISAFGKSKVKLSIFGVEFEVSTADLERTLTAAAGGSLTTQQWELLEKIGLKGSVSVTEEGYKMQLPGDLTWIRPIRNAGLIM